MYLYSVEGFIFKRLSEVEVIIFDDAISGVLSHYDVSCQRNEITNDLWSFELRVFVIYTYTSSSQINIDDIS